MLTIFELNTSQSLALLPVPGLAYQPIIATVLLGNSPTAKIGKEVPYRNSIKSIGP